MTQNSASYIDDLKLMDFARNSAGGMIISGETSMTRIRKRLFKSLGRIKRAHKEASAYTGGEGKVPPECEWLLDNWYLVERDGLSVLDEIKRAGRFPKTDNGLPAVFRLAANLISLGEAHLKASKILVFLKGAQKIRPFEEGELWVFLAMLKTAVIFEIEDVSKRLLHYNAAKRRRDGRDLSSDERAAIEGLFKNLFTSLRKLSSGNLAEAMAKASVLEKTLAEDPSGIYPRMDEGSRAYYRHTLTRLARKCHISETEAARRVIKLCGEGKTEKDRHVGAYILDKPLGKRRPKWPGRLYFVLLAILAGGFITAAAFISGGIYLPLILALPFIELSKNLCDYFAIRIKAPRLLPRLELSGGLPAGGRTLAVISTLLSSGEKAEHFAGLIERYMLANKDSGTGVSYGILADFPDSDRAVNEKDKETAEKCAAAIEKLNRRYGGGFYLFLRRRELNKKDNRYMGFERKRGAILNLCAYLRGSDCGSLTLAAGEADRLKNTAFLITLDADTRLCAGSVRQIVGSMLHPLNRAVTDEKKRVVTSGHAILQPRISVDLEAAGKSLFSRVFAGQGGIDPYASSVSDVYHDLFDEGIFTGKGILDIDVVNTCLAGRFPKNTILSHDLLEGAYLRAGLLGDVELTDGYPHGIISYFQRLHRWIRGDWQAARWLFRHVKNESGEREKNPISPLSKWKLFDNVRRAVTPAAILAAVIPCLFVPSALFCTGAGLAALCYLSAFLISGGELVFRSRLGRGARYHSSIVEGAAGLFARSAMQLAFLPHAAFISVNAGLTALWRMLVSGKKMLEWVTSDEAEGKTHGLSGIAHVMRVQMLFAVGVIALSLNPVGWVAGGIWLLGPLLAAFVSAVPEKPRKCSERDRAFLLREAALMWTYFSDFLNHENNYLPPDNYQQQPAVGAAPRTSPTNIGLALLCAVSAKDMGFINEDELLILLDNMLGAVEKLSKWNGHLLNWYDIKTCRPLAPRCVSSVDSGNLAGCLTALAQALGELDKTEAAALAERAERLSSAMDFSALYDKKQRLFYISRDLDTGKPSEGHYDLMASEARQTSYIAVARGEAERRHWSRLSRALASCDRYRGMVSWTGTMFEYLMPHLLLPLYENSLAYESARFALYCQKKHGAQRNMPWGISESAFYSFDPALNYQYKAHGVQRLGLKRGLDRESVVSPYSSFLALGVEPSAAVRNLRKLRELGMEGRYGFFEAADYTPSRLAGDKKYEIVRCFMVHHLGMSLVAINNLLNENIFQKRFMRDPRMAAFSELLQEKVPVGASVMRPVTREVPEKPSRADEEGFNLKLTGYSGAKPRVHALSNGSYSLLLSDAGESRSSCLGLEITRFTAGAGRVSLENAGASGQIYLLRYARQDGKSPFLGFTAAPFYGDGERGAEFTGKGAKFFTRGQDVSLEMEISIPANDNGELRELKITNKSKKPLECEIAAYFEPVLARREDYTSHTAFSKLFLETGFLDGSVIVRRKDRGSGKDIFLAFSCDSSGFRYDTSREKAFGRGGFSAIETAFETTGSLGAVVDPCVFVRAPVTLAGEESVTRRFALAVAGTAEDAAASAARILKQTPGRGVTRLDGHARLLGLGRGDIVRAFGLLSKLTFGGIRETASPEVLNRGQRGLWAYGLSGDLPIMLFYAGNGGEKETISKAIRLARFLHLGGAEFDMLAVTNDGAGYMRPARGAVLETLKAINAEGCLNARGGVHVLDAGELSDDDQTYLRACASVIMGEEGGEDDLSPTEALSPAGTTSAGNLEAGYNGDGSFSFTCDGKLPKSAWSHVLANNSFGYIATDAGTGHMWRFNSRENKMTPWTNDPLALHGGEQIEIRVGTMRFSPFAALDGYKTKVTYGFGFARWEKEIGSLRTRLTAFVPPSGMSRIMTIELWDNSRHQVKNVSVRYGCDIVMGVGIKQSDHIVTTYDNNKSLFTAQNPFETQFGPQAFHFIASPTARPCGDKKPRRFDAEILLPDKTGTIRAVLVSGCSQNEPGEKLFCSFASPETADKTFAETISWWNERLAAIKLDTPAERLNNYINGWTFYQAEACRLFARTSLYQCGGAYGFRDQLQDVCALVYADPIRVRNQILRACAHQFEEGDVQHWWHPYPGVKTEGHKGVRTKCSDDLLWLPYTLCEYMEKTGDLSILDVKIPYLKSPPLEQGEHERYEAPIVSEIREKVFSHCERAIEAALIRGTGTHGLPFIGSGDWNDGFNLVGAEGSGESVWLGWFFAHVLDRFIKLCAEIGENGEKYIAERDRLISACENAWDGKWYLRGYYDDGSTLGSAKDMECKIDFIAQSFSTLCAVKDEARRKIAMASAAEQLIDRQHSIIRLFAPSFEKSPKNPGYIKGYLPGVRENGGQYTHAAVWAAMGFLNLGENNSGFEILDMLLPSSHDREIYRTEPYVIPADVYYNKEHSGRGGWSWYTGAAGWYARVTLENLCGVAVRYGRLCVEPKLPSSWPGFSMVLQHQDKIFEISVRRAGDGEKTGLFINGTAAPEDGIPLDLCGQKNNVLRVF